MTLRERTRYPLAPEEIWPYLEKADLFVKWNRRIKNLNKQDAFSVGDEFWTEYVLSKKTTVCSSRVVEIESPVRLVLEHTRCQTQTEITELHVRESFELVATRGGTELRHDVHIRNHGLPFYVALLFWLVTTFGSTVEADLLEKLLTKRLKAGLGHALK